MKINKIKTDGQGNIVIQDISDSTINIDTSSSEKVLEFIESLQNWHLLEHTNILNLIVLATTSEQVQYFMKNENVTYLPIESYGEEVSHWKPFLNEETIAKILVDFQLQSGFKIEAYFINDIELNDELISHLKDDICPKTVLIVDCISLYFENNKTFAKIFDNNDIGGCLIPICEKQSIDSKEKMIELHQLTFTHLNQCFWNRLKKEYMHIELNVPCKKRLFRRLTNIAVKKLNITSVNIPWSPALSKFKNADVFAKLNSSL